MYGFDHGAFGQQHSSSVAQLRGKQIKDGGEGTIHEVNGHPDLLMKIYKKTDNEGKLIVTPELEAKISYMKDHPPTHLVEQSRIAWPLELVYENGKFTGFIMPRLNFDAHIQKIYIYQHPDHQGVEYQKYPSVKSRIAIGVNLSAMLYDLHQAGYVIGDFNDQNIGIKYATGQVYMMDCDSFHITKENGEVLRTGVIMPGFLAPEIIKHCANERANGRVYNLDEVALPTFTRESDLFCLALHIFKLIMNGIDPFRGVNIMVSGSAASPFTGNEAIERGAYVFKPGNRPSAVFCPALGCLPPNVLGLFNRAFLDSRQNPQLRPNTTEWYQSLVVMLEELTQCEKNGKHYFHQTLASCPYCKADENYSKEFLGSAYANRVTTDSVKVSPPTATFQPKQPTVNASKPTISSLRNSIPAAATVTPTQGNATLATAFNTYKPVGFTPHGTTTTRQVTASALPATNSIFGQKATAVTPSAHAPVKPIIPKPVTNKPTLSIHDLSTKNKGIGSNQSPEDPAIRRRAPGGHRANKLSIDPKAHEEAIARFDSKHDEMRQLVDNGSLFAVDLENEDDSTALLEKINKDVYTLVTEAKNLMFKVSSDEALSDTERNNYKRCFDKIACDVDRQLNFYFIKIFCDFISKDYLAAKVFSQAAVEEYPQNKAFTKMFLRAADLAQDG